jgi:hypothetical protein
VAEVPDEILEDSKFVAINDDDPRFGPPVSKFSLLSGYPASCMWMRVTLTMWKLLAEFINILMVCRFIDLLLSSYQSSIKSQSHTEWYALDEGLQAMLLLGFNKDEVVDVSILFLGFELR